MSGLSAQCDELRAMAGSVGLAVPKAATLMMEAADTICELAGGTRTARRVIVSDPSTDCATGYCVCGACGEPIDPWDLYCRWCGARMEDE